MVHSLKPLVIVGGGSQIGRALGLQLREDYSVFGTVRDDPTSEYYLDFDKFDKTNLNIPPNSTILWCVNRYIQPSLVEISENEYIERSLLDISLFVQRFAGFISQIVFFSTDLIFSNISQKPGILSERDGVGAYPKSKIAIEDFLRASNLPFKIIRLGKVIETSVFLNAAFDLLKQKQSVTAYDNLYFSPITMDVLCNVVNKIILNCKSEVIHLSNKNQISYFETCRLICKLVGAAEESVEPVSLDEADPRFRLSTPLGDVSLNWELPSPRKCILDFYRWKNDQLYSGGANRN